MYDQCDHVYFTDSDGGMLEGQDSPSTVPSSSTTNTPTNKLKTTSLKQVLAQQVNIAPMNCKIHVQN
jgi:hypothetical protein